ncbi:MAG: single-stranded-DNA-specific exonuclease RecJ, partial [Candidatus Omnitrophica bacterium]|nr:single-stranded-DNA-specific exonuclease RecJ [Candidatus Omnitrophota bacterium]
MAKQWVFRPTESPSPEFVRELAVSPMFAELLSQRGLTDLSEARSYLNPDLNNLADPYLYSDMSLAVERIREAAERNERVLIYGDYDADGITAAAILFR